MRETNEVREYIHSFIGGAWDHGFSVERFRRNMGTLIAKRGRMSIHLFTNEKDFGFARVFDRKIMVAEIINFNWRDVESKTYAPAKMIYVDHNHKNQATDYGHVLGTYHQDTPTNIRPADQVIRIENCLFGLLIDAKLSLEPTVDPCSPDPGITAILTNEVFTDGSKLLAIIIGDMLFQFTRDDDADDFIMDFWNRLDGVNKIDDTCDGAVDSLNYNCVQVNN